MRKTTANPQVANFGRDPGRVSRKARWIISAAAGLTVPAILIAESAAAPIAEAVACFGNGSFMAMAATANAFMIVP